MSSKAGSSPEKPEASLFRPPFTPRRRLFYALLAVQGIWVTVLLIVYFTTVYPQQTRPSTPVSPAPPAPTSGTSPS